MTISARNRDELDTVVNRLVNGLQPERITLFGSQAEGGDNDDSDFDLLVIVADSDLPRHRREALAYDLLWGLTTPVDVIVMTRAEYERSRTVRTSLAASADTRGRVLFRVR